MVVIIDYNLGNLKSILNATNKIGMDTIVSRDIDLIRKAEAIILPGVGTFGVAMENLKKFNLIDILKDRKEAGVPILGICLGMQILFEKGYEFKETDGLGFLKGSVDLIKTQEKIPHMGWNQLYFNKENFLMKDIPELSDVYFVHSYSANIPNEELICYTEYRKY